MKALAILFLVALLSKAILLYKTINTLPLQELRRRARAGRDGRTQAIYKLASYGPSLSILLWLVAGFSGAGLLILATQASWWLGLVFVLFLNWLVLGRQLAVQPGGWLWQIAGWMATIAAPVLSFLHPALSRVGRFAGSTVTAHHTNVYEKQDLLELLDRQAGQLDNRITKLELKIAKSALDFTDKKVSQVMTPAKEVKWLAADESIGPMLMDELHKTGHIRFPVVKDAAKTLNPAPTKSPDDDRRDQSVGEVVGALYIQDLLKNLEKPGTVADIMVRGVHFIGESHTLHQALDGFLKSKRHLLVVVNNFEEVVGVLTLEDVLEQILGQKITDDFDSYHDLQAVAGHDQKT